MKKVILLVAVFLIGSTTQTFSQRDHQKDHKQGKKHRYYNSQEIRFVENDVLYTVSTDGTFDFKIINEYPSYERGRRNHNVIYYQGAHGAVQYRTNKRWERKITLDRFGRVRTIGDSYITYLRNGKVRSIGNIFLQYHKDRLIQVGNMQIVYNKCGKIKDTHGFINTYNKQLWHDGWYNINDHGFAIENDYEYRERKRETQI